jgi:hypothetical protein
MMRTPPGRDLFNGEAVAKNSIGNARLLIETFAKRHMKIKCERKKAGAHRPFFWNGRFT